MTCSYTESQIYHGGGRAQDVAEVVADGSLAIIAHTVKKLPESCLFYLTK